MKIMMIVVVLIIIIITIIIGNNSIVFNTVESHHLTRFITKVKISASITYCWIVLSRKNFVTLLFFIINNTVVTILETGKNM